MKPNWITCIGWALLVCVMTAYICSVIALMVYYAISDPGFGLALLAFFLMWGAVSVCFREGWLK